MVAVVVAVVSRGSLLPVVVVTAFIGLVTLAYEACVKWYRSHHRRAAGSVVPAEGELSRWMAVVERLLRSAD
jgi:hypothetical protein